MARQSRIKVIVDADRLSTVLPGVLDDDEQLGEPARPRRQCGPYRLVPRWHLAQISSKTHSGTPSMMEANPMSVGMMRDKVNLASANKLRNSASERWRPPVHTSILTSFAAAPRLASD